MMIKHCLFATAMLTLVSLAATARNNCSGTPQTGVCPAPSAPVQKWCASGSSTKDNGSCDIIDWWGFATIPPGSGTAGSQFEGIDASAMHGPPSVVAPNGGVGPNVTVGSTIEGQYLQFAGDHLQAYDKTTGNPILSNVPNTGPAVPQSFGVLFQPKAGPFCNASSDEGIALYDRLDSAFVLGNISNPQNKSVFYYCLGVSANNAAAGSTSNNLLGGGNGKSYWNAYVYNVTPALPHKNKVVRYQPAHTRFGSWSDGFYLSWDLIDPATRGTIGFEVCKLDKASIIAGKKSVAPVCYTYIPSYAVGRKGTNDSLIHTLLPADFEGSNPIPSNTAGEYFLAQVNPNNPGTNNACNKLPCVSNHLAFWTWSGFTSQSAATMVTTANNYTPGCYILSKPTFTLCVPEPGFPSNFLDSMGDRLMHRLAYRVLQNTEYLAVAHTVEEDGKSGRTGVRYYKLQGGSTPTIVIQSGSSTLPDLQDSTNGNFYFAPSAAMDNNGDIGIAFTASGTSLDPTPYFVTTDTNGVAGAPVNICSGTGGCTATGEDQSDAHWGPLLSTTTDPSDDLTFWSTDEYFPSNQSSCCNWQTRIYTGLH